ncbi:MAG TPA: NPCBM/NEW2 domain-containing protein [Thermoguttaceae bacterium]|nr:NPCBM/NEW2 domain-containing protein [Thermoguttaceae bacterium]
MWSLLLIGVLNAAPPDFEVHLLGGDQRVGPIVELGVDRMTVRTAEGPVSLDTKEIAGISRRDAGPSDVPPGVWAELIDGSRLAGAEYTVREGRAGITRPSGEVTEVSARDVAAVRLQPPTGAIAAEWARILESELDADLLVVRKGDSIDYHRGTLGDVSDKVVEFDLEGDLLAVKRSKVYGLVYYRSAGRSLPDPACWLTDADGSRWAVKSIRLEGDDFRWTTPLGLETSRAAAEVVRIDFSQGKIVYLSDLEPESLVWTPYFGSTRKLPALARFFGPREDRGLDPGPLELDGTQYEKGLALHSRTSLVYRLPGRFRRFKAVVGIDDRVRPQGNVRLVIRGDDRVLLETTVTGTDPPLPVDLDLSGVRRLAILVDYGADLDVADHLDLCNARIVK